MTFFIRVVAYGWALGTGAAIWYTAVNEGWPSALWLLWSNGMTFCLGWALAKEGIDHANKTH